MQLRNNIENDEIDGSNENLSQEESAFNQLHNETLCKIFSFLRPETITPLIFLTDPRFKKFAEDNLFWMEKLNLHFPETYVRLMKKYNNKFVTTNLITINWRAEFITTYKETYEKVDRQVRRMFSIAIEGDHESCYDKDGLPLPLPLTWVDVTNANRQTFLGLLQELNNREEAYEKIEDGKTKELKYQNVLDYIYHTHKKFFTDFNFAQGKETINPTKRDGFGCSLLWAAIHCHQSLKEIIFLLSKGIALNETYPTFGHCSPIHIAAEQGRLELLEFILKIRPGDLNAKDIHDQTPLMYAAKKGRLSVVQFLLKQKGLDKTAKTKSLRPLENDQTALHLAATHGHGEVAIALLKAGLDATLPSGDMNFLPIHCAARAGKLALVKAILERHPEQKDLPDNHGQTLLLWAASKGYLDIVEYLIQLGGVNLNAKSQNFGISHVGEGRTALHYAALNGHDEVVFALLEAGADPTISTPARKELPIHLAVSENHLQSVKLLLDHSPVLLNTFDIYGESPIMRAASKEHLPILEYLLSKDEEKIARSFINGQGKNALHYAAEIGKQNAVKMLLNAGVDPTIKFGTSKFSVVHQAVQINHLEMVKLLIEHPGHPSLLNVRGFHGQTPLMLASSSGSFDIVIYLLSKLNDGLDLNAKTDAYPDEKENGKTALHLAAEFGHSKIVEILLQNGAVIDLTRPFQTHRLNDRVKAELARHIKKQQEIEQQVLEEFKRLTYQEAPGSPREALNDGNFNYFRFFQPPADDQVKAQVVENDEVHDERTKEMSRRENGLN